MFSRIFKCNICPFFRKSLDLVEALLRLAEAGHYEAVLKLFAYPVKNCPDVLLLDLLQVNVSLTNLLCVKYLPVTLLFVATSSL